MPPDTEKILVINPGSTSTKVAIFTGLKKHAEITEQHSSEELRSFETLPDQLFFREAVVRRFLRAHGWEIENLDAVAGRGGMLHPLDGGIYRVGPVMLDHLRSSCYGEHASNLGAQLAREIAERADCPAYIVDPIAVDELDEPARLSGHPEIPRRSVFHALNQRSVARLVAERIGKSYGDSRFIVAHLGGGISIGAHKNGRVIDVNNALDGDGPFTPERVGTLPTGQVVSLCFGSGKPESEIRRMIKGAGGVVAYCGTNDIRELLKQKNAETLSESSIPPEIVFEALCRQIAQAICAHGATLEGKVDAVILTGGMAYSSEMVKRLKTMCGWMAPVEVVSGEREMEALAEGAVRALRGEEPVKEYQK
ncbi:MAG: butyrate kinase [Spirochaetaceae bacterium]|nr:butyrate kinase [Spirochaetaceae bacterium]